MQTQSKRSRQWLLGLSIGLAIILFLSANIAVDNWFGASRVDLTENRLYSLSDGTRTLLAELDEPLHMRLYLSEDLLQSAPQLASYSNRVRSMLETYADLSDGKIVVEIVNPQPFSDEEDRAVGLGVDRFRVAGASDPLFFGLAATNSTDGKAVIPVFTPERERFLEYDLTRLVAELGHPDKPVVAILDGLGLAGGAAAGGEQQVLVQLRELFDVEFVSGDVDALPEGTRVVLVVHPQDLSERTLYTLDQWVLGGGATLVFVDPYAETQPGEQPGLPPADSSSDLARLFDAWGVGFDDAKAIGDPASALRTVREVGDGRQIEVTQYPWIAIRGDGMDQADAILSQLSSIVMTTAGAFTASGEDTTLTPLLSTSQEAGFLDAARAADRFADPRRLLASLERSSEPLVVAARLSGKLKTAFPDGKPEGSEAEGEPVSELTGPPNVILVGDADMLMDRSWISYGSLFGQRIAQEFANNGDFVINAVEQMAGGAELADLRGRGVSWRPFDRIAALERDAESRFLAKEQALLERMRETEKKISELDVAEESDGGILSADSLEAIEEYRSDLLATRAELRQVRYELRRDVDALKRWVTVMNVAAVPAAIAVLAVGMGLRRPKRPIPKRTTPPSS